MDSDTYQQIETTKALAQYDIASACQALTNLYRQLEELAVSGKVLATVDDMQERLRLMSHDVAAYKVVI